MYALCRACHVWIHRRFGKPLAWIAYKHHVRRGGYGHEFTSALVIKERKAFNDAYVQGKTFMWSLFPHREKQPSAGWWEHLTLDPHSLTNPLSRGRPSMETLEQGVRTMQNTPVFTEQNFISALLKLRDKKYFRNTKYLEMLRAQHASKEHTITATNLAKDIGYENYNSANLHYGKLGHLVAKQMSFTPEQRKNGEPMWWQALSNGNQGSPETIDGHFEFVMRPELIAALETMNWVK